MQVQSALLKIEHLKWCFERHIKIQTISKTDLIISTTDMKDLDRYLDIISEIIKKSELQEKE